VLSRANSLENYRDKTPAEALADFRERLKHYERSYQPLDDEKDADLSYIKVICSVMSSIVCF